MKNTVNKEHMNTLPKIVAVDFDGTIVEDRFPDIGKPIRGMVDLLKTLQSKDVKLILWTCRDNDTEDRSLDRAVEFCKSLGIVFDAVNTNIPETISMFNNDTRKVYADVYLDDKSVVAYQDPLYWTWKLGFTVNIMG